MASDASPPITNNATAEEATTTPILEELKRLQEVDHFLTKLWQDEVHQYEQTTSSSSSLLPGGKGEGGDDDDDAADMNGRDDYIIHNRSCCSCVSRNYANSTGTVENESLFPYHTALYPLLDCYDSIMEGGDNRVAMMLAPNNSPTVVRPSPAPLPYQVDGHRRSMNSPRLDRYGVQIEEIESITEHLPNSAWAIQQSLMPHHRKIQYMDYEMNPVDDDDDDDGEHQRQSNVRRDENQDFERFRNDDYRFWNILMNPELEAYPILSDEMSVWPEVESDSDEWEDVEGDESVDISNREVREPGRTRLDRVNNAKNARDFRFLRWWRRAIVQERNGVIQEPVETRRDIIASNDRYSPESLFADNRSSSARIILLKVLKHSLSDLQCELRLAQAVVLLIADWKLCDDNKGMSHEGEDAVPHQCTDSIDGIECLRRLLLIISSEYFSSCGGYCHERYLADVVMREEDAPNHYCSDWWEFLASFSILLSEGIPIMTHEHASVICAFVSHEMNRAGCPAGSMGVFIDGGEMSGKQYLKQSIHFLNNAEYEMGRTRTEGGVSRASTTAECPLRINVLLTILSAVRRHALSDRMKLAKLVDKMNTLSLAHVTEQDKVSLCLSSYQTCIDIIVDIGERVLFRLPNNLHGRQLGGMVVRGLVESFVGCDDISMKVQRPLSYLARETDTLRSIVDPLRYADAVTKSTNSPLMDPCRSPGINTAGHLLMKDLIGIQPTRDVIDIVKGLFTRDLVDLQVSGCGYGDFLSWCHLPISPEPLLFYYASNFPDLRVGDEHEPPSEEWVVDEVGNELDYTYLNARYDFSLLVFLRHWYSPWTPESHLSFSVPFRSAVSTLALCAHRFGAPSDMVALVNSFMPRTWWPDDRRCCWCHDCQLDQLLRVFNEKVRSRKNNWGSQSSLGLERKKRTKPETLITCPGCQVVSACSKEHMKYLHKDGHKRVCGLPPFRLPLNEEDKNLCREILGSAEGVVQDMKSENCENYDEIDDGSWESVESNQEAAESMSDVIFSFFNNNSYKIQHRGVQFPFWS